MNNKGNIMINLLFFMMSLAVLVMFINPISEFIGIAQQSDNLNCQGYIYQGNTAHPLSYNSSLNTNSMTCLAIKLYLPYLVVVFLVAGVIKLLYDKAGFSDQTDTGGGY